MKGHVAAACSLSCLLVFAGSAYADQVVLDFEGQAADSADVPAGWSYVDSGLGTSGTYVNSTAGGGSTGSGLGGVLVSTNPTHGTNLPHSFLVNSGSASGFDVTQSIVGSYDFKLTHANQYDSAGFLFGDIKSGLISGTDAGQLLMMSHTNGGFNQANAESRFTDGANVSTYAPPTNAGFGDDIWYRIAFTWTPTSGTTGDFSYTATRWNGSTFVAHSTFGITGHTFSNPEAYIAIADMWATSTTFDNISVTGTFVNAFDPADLDQDGDVDDADFGIAFAAFTGPNNGPSNNPAADLDGDGDVDDADFGIAFAAFTGPGGGAGVVPEPASLALLGLGGLIVARRRRA